MVIFSFFEVKKMGCGCGKSKSRPGVVKKSITLSPTSKVVSLGSNPSNVVVSLNAGNAPTSNVPANNVQDRNISKNQRDIIKKRRDAILRRQGKI